MAATYEPIATNTLGSAAASYTFSSIPSSYTDLIIVANAGSTSATNDYLQFNGDTGSNYSWTRLYGNGSSAGSQRATSSTSIFLGDLATSINLTEVIQIQNYSNSTTYKTIITRNSNPASSTNATVGLWRNTAAITSITLIASGTTYLTGSTFTLYGIKAA